jgi:hypothetical protein
MTDLSKIGVKPNYDIPAAADPVLRKLEGAVNAENPTGGEVRRERYKLRSTSTLCGA